MEESRVIPDRAAPGRPALIGLAAALALVVFITAGCHQPASPRQQVASKLAASEPCAAEPLAPFDCGEEGASDQTSSQFSGELTAIEAPDEFGRRHFVVREPSGVLHRLAVQPPDLEVPLEIGHAYGFKLDRVGGAPTASGLIVRDGETLVFAGASDQGIGSHVLAGGIPGFDFELLAPTCASRAEGNCFDAVFNRPLRVSHGGEHVELFQGGSAQLAGYEVQCRIAQQVTYSGRCADFAVHAVSYTIARLK